MSFIAAPLGSLCSRRLCAGDCVRRRHDPGSVGVARAPARGTL